MERNQDESEMFPFLELVNDFKSRDLVDETISDEFIYLIRGKKFRGFCQFSGQRCGPHSIDGAGLADNGGLADDGQFSSPFLDCLGMFFRRQPPRFVSGNHRRRVMDLFSSSMKAACKYLDASETETVVCINPYIYHCCKSCARKRQTRYLPQDLLFNILLHLPARVLHEVMRHVCGEWNLMISNPNFIHHHLCNSMNGILIQELYPPHDVIYVELRRGSVKICKFDYRLEGLVSTSNGLVLNPYYEDLYVINPLTNQWTFIPPYFDRRRDHAFYFYLTFVEASMEYKVVHAILDQTLDHRLRMQIAVLTIGVDKVWRHIDTEHLPLLSMEALVNSPLVTGAYIHWIRPSFVLTLNVETETICRFPLPPLGNRRQSFRSMGNYLSIICESNEFFRDVWEMNPETGQWTMLLSVDLESLTYIFKDLVLEFSESIIPFGWLVDREVLLFSTLHLQTLCVAYNIKTRETQSFELNTKRRPHNFQAHVNSLVSLEKTFQVD